MKSKRGFAAMDPQKHKAIASLGGKTSQSQGTGHNFSSEEARQAGSKGGARVSRNRRYMASIGKKGGEVSGMESVIVRESVLKLLKPEVAVHVREIAQHLGIRTKRIYAILCRLIDQGQAERKGRGMYCRKSLRVPDQGEKQ